MSQFRLKPGQRRRVRRLLDETSDLNAYRRCLALMEVGAGRPVADVARSPGVTRQSIHNRIARFGGVDALADCYGGGHPMALEGQDVEDVVALLGHSPQHFWPPKRAPELNPIEGLCGDGEDIVCADHQYGSFDEQSRRYVAYLVALSNPEALKKAGVLS